MTNRNELRAQIVRHGDTNQSLADAFHYAVSTISKKVNGERDFTQTEIDFIKRRYKLTPDEIDLIFFTQTVD